MKMISIEIRITSLSLHTLLILQKKSKLKYSPHHSYILFLLRYMLLILNSGLTDTEVKKSKNEKTR